MAFVHGKKAALLLDGLDISGYFHEVSLGTDIDTAEVTTFGASWKSYIAGQAVIAVEGAGYFDPTQTALTTALTASADSVLTVGPGGLAAAGDAVRTIQVRETSFAETADIGDAVGFDWSATSDTVPGFGVLLEPLTAVTGDQNGTARDGGAATTTGAVAHLHVTSVSAADSIIVTIEDSATGSSGWATIGTFASKAAAGAERIVIAGTVRRYTRVVDDVTGASVSIVRSVALART
jgi:hypothetical protein